MLAASLLPATSVIQPWPPPSDTAWLNNQVVMQASTLDFTFAALADPTRRAILKRLAAGEATVGELAAPFAMTQPAVSKHLRVLERAGLISRGRDAQRRPCRLEAPALRAATDWLEDLRQRWQESYVRLDALLAELKVSERQGRRHGSRG
jgi:DNA-binding transcriptional ArsR family regulator